MKDNSLQTANMTKQERVQMECNIERILRKSVSSDYTLGILHCQNEQGVTVMNDIVQDIIETSAWHDEKYYNDDDVRLAIGRVLSTRLGLEV